MLEEQVFRIVGVGLRTALPCRRTRPVDADRRLDDVPPKAGRRRGPGGQVVGLAVVLGCVMIQLMTSEPLVDRHGSSLVAVEIELHEVRPRARSRRFPQLRDQRVA